MEGDAAPAAAAPVLQGGEVQSCHTAAALQGGEEEARRSGVEMQRGEGQATPPSLSDGEAGSETSSHASKKKRAPAAYLWFLVAAVVFTRSFDQVRHLSRGGRLEALSAHSPVPVASARPGVVFFGLPFVCEGGEAKAALTLLAQVLYFRVNVQMVQYTWFLTSIVYEIALCATPLAAVREPCR
jgi:hypothetical protein